MESRQVEVVVAGASSDLTEQVGRYLDEAGFAWMAVPVGLDGLSRVAAAKPHAILLLEMDDAAREWVLNFVEDNPAAPAVVSIAPPSALYEAPEWLYDVVDRAELEPALTHRLQRAIAFRDMRRVSAQRIEELGRSGAQLRMVAMIDVVTGLFNQRYFRKHLRESYAASRRYKRPLSCLVLRLDSFGELQEELGTEGTNDVLDSVALAISTVIRESDTAARLTDDLFGFLLPETSAEGAEGLVQRLVTRLKTARFPHDIGIRVSTAYAQLEASHPDGNALLDAVIAKLPARQ